MVYVNIAPPLRTGQFRLHLFGEPGLIESVSGMHGAPLFFSRGYLSRNPRKKSIHNAEYAAACVSGRRRSEGPAGGTGAASLFINRALRIWESVFHQGGVIKGLLWVRIAHDLRTRTDQRI